MPPAPRDDYYAFMWTFSGSIFTHGPERARKALDRFREMACTGATCIASFVRPDGFHKSLEKFGLEPASFPTPELNASPFLENDFPYYLENICRPIYEKWEKRKPLFRRQYETFHQTRDRKVFVHPCCVNNPDIDRAVRERIAGIMDELAPARHLCLLYDLRDEPSITSFLLASDWCFCDHCLARMRQWLRHQYGDLDGLNRQWGTTFTSWDQVQPMTTEEALDRRLAGDWNFSPWADHRAFMNQTFARVVAEWADEIRKYDPEALCGLEGTQCPSIFGGYDFSLLVPILDWCEPYDFGGSIDCFRSFKQRRHVPLLRTSGLGGDIKVRENILWTTMFYAGGDGGAIIWNSDTSLNVNSPDLELTPTAKATGQVLAELRSGPPRLLQCSEEVSSPVALHYSQASINADFMVTLPHRWQSIAGWEDGPSLACRCRDAWLKLLEDRGIRPVFVSSQQIEAGELNRGRIRLLILPRSIAISDAEAAAVRRFVEAGGILAADSFPGRMDHHCRERAQGALDELFGIRRLALDNYHAVSQRASFDWDQPTGPRPRWGQGRIRTDLDLMEELIEPVAQTRILGCTEMSDIPIGFLAERGRGKAVLFNAAPIGYLHARQTPGGGKAYRDMFGGILSLAGVIPHVQVRLPGSDDPVPGWRVFPFRHGQARYFGLAPDLGVTQNVLGAIDAAARDDSPRTVVLNFPVAGHVFEVRSGRYVGQGQLVQDSIRMNSPLLYSVMPYRPERMELAFDGKVATASLKLPPASEGQPGEHVFRFDLFDAAGNRLLDAGANVVASAGRARWTPDSSLPPGGKLVCRDVATGTLAEVRPR